MLNEVFDEVPSNSDATSTTTLIEFQHMLLSTVPFGVEGGVYRCCCGGILRRELN